MNKFILMALALGIYSMPATATDVDTDHLMFPEDVEAAYVAANEQAAMDQVITGASAQSVADNNDVRTQAIQRKFASRRAFNARGFNPIKEQYNEDSAWIGATDKIENGPASLHGDRLNKMFKSRRAYRP